LLKNIGSTNRNNGRVTVEAKIQVTIIFRFLIDQDFRHNLAIRNNNKVSIKTVRAQSFINRVRLTFIPICFIPLKGFSPI
jgi:hypothetical protein